MICPTPKPELRARPLPPQPPSSLGEWRGSGEPQRAPLRPSASCCSLLHLSPPPSTATNGFFPLVPYKASPPTPRPLEISPSAVSTHQGIVSNQVSFLRGKRVHLLHLAHPVSDGDALLSPALTSVSPLLPSTSQLFQTTFPLRRLSLP